MKITEKDRGQLLRMAGNIACGLVGYTSEEKIPALSAKIAYETMQSVDKLIQEANDEQAN
jgi:hypothetical protein